MSVLECEARLAARNFDLRLTVEVGETVALLGPNGAGKSTLLALLAGLVAPDSGSATLDGVTLFDARQTVPVHRRGISLLAQEALLFPHLSVLENVAFGPRSRGSSRAQSQSLAHSWLAEVDAADFADRRPWSLSGGEAQRVAVARALAVDPKLLLLDEPMGALDVTTVPAMRGMLKRVLADRTAIIVTHDVVDAYTLADRVIVLDGGRIVDSGPTREVLARPRSAFAAALVGLNLLADGVTVVAPADISVSTVSSVSTVAGSFGVGGEGAGLQGMVLQGTVASIETRADLVRVRVRADDVAQAGELAADLTPLAFAELDVLPGARVWLSFTTSG